VSFKNNQRGGTWKSSKLAIFTKPPKAGFRF
jgi:hypothetical protein